MMHDSTCDCCGRLRLRGEVGWGVDIDDGTGLAREVACPDCLTPDEAAEVTAGPDWRTHVLSRVLFGGSC